jgi:hypothetical protein
MDTTSQSDAILPRPQSDEQPRTALLRCLGCNKILQSSIYKCCSLRCNDEVLDKIGHFAYKYEVVSAHYNNLNEMYVKMIRQCRDLEDTNKKLVSDLASAEHELKHARSNRSRHRTAKHHKSRSRSDDSRSGSDRSPDSRFARVDPRTQPSTKHYRRW